jgi:hypothetical protein
MEVRVTKLAICPSDLGLSLSLARQFLCFLKQWVLAYVCSAVDDKAGNISLFWSGKEVSQQVIEFCVWLCSQYFHFWPQDKVIQESATDLLTVLAKRNPSIQSFMIQSTPFYDLAMLEFNTLGLSVGLSAEEFDAAIRAQNPS